MKIYNTYTREKEDFKPIEQMKVRMYVCGPTVYDDIHIGNARPVIFFDVVNRYFKYLGYDVNYVSNITDVDDRIINKAESFGISEQDVSKKYLKHYLDCCELLNVMPVDEMPKVTETIVEIIDFIDRLVAGGFAYESDGDIYFRVAKVATYGKLSGKKIDDLIVGARIEENLNKESPLDFTLWKKTKKGITWDSPWGPGRPGWHTECVVMIDKAFDGKIDIHGGGPDLQFPHHENEIAQSICSNNHTIANYWMHVGRLGLIGDNEKMSKSIGNVIFVKDLLKDSNSFAFRMFMLLVHYRQPINFSYELLELATKEWQKVKQAYDSLCLHLDLENESEGIKVSDSHVAEIMDRFLEAMADDFNTANAITYMYSLVKEINKKIRSKEDTKKLRNVLKVLEDMLFILGFTVERIKLTKDDKALYRKWEQARSEKNFELADELRGHLQERGLI